MKVSKNMIVALVLLVLIAGGGAAGWYWISGQIDDLQSKQSEVIGNIAALEKKTYSPVSGNLILLQKSDEELQGLLDAFRDELRRRDAVFDSVRQVSPDGTQKGLEPDAWKKLFGSVRDRLTKDAAEAKVRLPQDYDFSFSAYRLSLPSDNLTLPLGIQLLSIEKLSDALISSKVQSINFIKRADVESRGGPAGKEGADLFGASILQGPAELYKVYPFSISFVCSPRVFPDVINKIVATDLLFVIRDIAVENDKQSIPLASQVKGALTSGGGSGGSDKPSKLVIPVLGQELLQVNLRVDLLYLTVNAPAEQKTQAAKPNAKQRK